MFLRRFVSTTERARHPPRSRSPSPPRVKRIEMQNMPEPSEELRAASRHASYSAAYPDGPDPEQLKDRLTRAVSENINFQPALPMPEEGVVGFDELKERNEQQRQQLGYENSDVPIARLSFVGMPSPPASRPVSQNMTGQKYYQNHHNSPQSESEDNSDGLSIHTTATSMASEYSPAAASASLKTANKKQRLSPSPIVRRSGVYPSSSINRRTRSAGGPFPSANANRIPQRRVLTIQVRHPQSPGKSRLSEMYSPAEAVPGSRMLARQRWPSGAATPPITEEEFAQLQVENEHSNAALNATLEELDIVKTELARIKRRARQEIRAAAKEREYVAEDLADTREELKALKEDFDLLEQDADRDYATATQLHKRLKRQTTAFAALQKQVTEREEAVKNLEVDAAEKDRLMSEVSETHEQLQMLQAELAEKKKKLELAEDPEHSNTLWSMKAAALIEMLAKLEIENKGLAQERDFSTEARSHAERMLVSYKARMADQQSKVAELESSTSVLNAIVLRLETAIVNTAKELGATSESKTALETELVNIKSELATTKEKMGAFPTKEQEVAAEEEIEASAATAVELEAQVTELTAALDDEQANVDKLQNELETLAEDMTKKEAAMAAELDKAKETLTAMKSERAELKAMLDFAREEADRINVRAFNIDGERGDAQADVERISKEKETVEKELVEAKEKILSLEAAADKAKKGDAAVQITILTQANESLEAQRDAFEAQLAEATARMQQLEYDWINSNGQIASLQAELGVMTAHVAFLELEEVHYKVQIESLSDRIAKDRSRKDKHHHSSSSSGSVTGGLAKKATLKAGRNEELIIVRNAGGDKGSIYSRKECSGQHRGHRSRSPRRRD